MAIGFWSLQLSPFTVLKKEVRKVGETGI